MSGLVKVVFRNTRVEPPTTEEKGPFEWATISYDLLFVCEKGGHPSGYCLAQMGDSRAWEIMEPNQAGVNDYTARTYPQFTIEPFDGDKGANTQTPEAGNPAK